MIVSQDKITSRQNRLVVETGKLCDRKERTARRQFCIDGIKLFREAVEKGVTVVRVFLAESKASRMMAELEALAPCEALADAVVHILSDDVFVKLSAEQAPEGILAVATFPAFHVTDDQSRDVLLDVCRTGGGILLLESVRDPGNVGTILRSAAAFGIDCVAISADCADIYNTKTVRGAMGALFRMKIAVFGDITEAILLIRQNGRRVYAAALDHEALRLTPSTLSRRDCAVIGNEGHGLSADAIAACDRSLYIPMEAGSESLNAAAAATVILWSMYNG